MDLDCLDYEDLLLIMKKEEISELFKKYKEIKHESDTYKEMLLLLKLIKPSYLPCKIKLSHIPSGAFDKKTM